MTDHDAPPTGYRLVPARTTYLEMLRDEVAVQPAVAAGFRVERWDRPDVDRYRALFAAVGADWGWTGRELLSDEALRDLLDDPAIAIYRLLDETGDDGPRIAGFAELERGRDGNVEIVYFGLTPEYIGRGLGGTLLRWAIHRAWHEAPPEGFAATRRLWLHTCDFDSDAALGFYRHAGFAVYDERVEMEPYPEAFLARLGR